MRAFLLFCLLCLSLYSGSAARLGKKSTAAPTPRMLFVFGDSYADTGNGASTGPGWRSPYGITWPGTPTGRYSDGYVKTDVLASGALNVPTPPSYSLLTSSTSISGGVNFAVAGSGASQAYGAPPLQTQVGWLADMVSKGVFASDALKNSIVFVSVAGNDYGAYSGSTLEGYADLVKVVTTKMDLGLRQLYSLGIRNFIVSSLSALSCTPLRTYPSGFAACEKNATVEGVVLAHNLLLGKKLKTITKDLNDADILYLQQTKAMTEIIKNPSKFGLTEGLKPCCVGLCGQVNATTGAPLYQVCSNPDQHMFWDNLHPTQAAWKVVVNLYLTQSGYTQFSPSLKKWVGSLFC